MKLTKEQKKEIEEQQSQKNSTKRVTSPELEKYFLYFSIGLKKFKLNLNSQLLF